MTLKQLQHIKDLTARNDHGEAREYIASQFEYCKQLENIFHKINEIHNITGYIDLTLSHYRSEKSDELMRKIELMEGKDIMNQIKQAI